MFSKCNSLKEIQILARQLKEGGTAVSLVNSEATKRRQELADQVNPNYDKIEKVYLPHTSPCVIATIAFDTRHLSVPVVEFTQEGILLI